MVRNGGVLLKLNEMSGDFELPLTRGLAQWRDRTIPDRHNIFEQLNMGWSEVTWTIATAPSPGRWPLFGNSRYMQSVPIQTVKMKGSFLFTRLSIHSFM